ncbi:uncharacterized protein JCM6883_005590 [Sporobolomyces salmoneus]|uniref:uncharacterized protein n=1 Tax=Sporobolomyces salmoneus TaxID=183962 RepID=UPI003175EE72
MDPLSRLPGELLDYIFELAASTSGWIPELTSGPISKSLLPSQERAIYETITIGRPGNFPRLRRTHSAQSSKAQQLLRTLDAQAQRGQHAKKLVFAGLPESLDPEALLRYLPNLVEFEFHIDKARALQILAQPELLPSLRFCRFPNVTLTSSIVDCLSRIPTLRSVEVSRIEDEENEGWVPVCQVLRLDVCAVYSLTAFFKLFQFFPTASISSLEFLVNDDEPLLPVLDVLNQNLYSLKLETVDVLPRAEMIDHLLPQFSNLRHLHLDPPFFSETLPTQLLQLPHLTSLSLTYYEQDPNLEILLDGLALIPHLRSLTFRYDYLPEYEHFNFAAAEKESNGPGKSPRYGSRSLLKNITRLAQIDGLCLPWKGHISDILPRVVKAEKRAREAGLVVESNLVEITENFHRGIVECYNRVVADLYFNGRMRPLRYALSLAQKHALDINRIEFDLARNFNRKDLEWFEDKVVGLREFYGSMDWCRIYGLRLKE